jgi:hypothetical protein
MDFRFTVGKWPDAADDNASQDSGSKISRSDIDLIIMSRLVVI